MLCCNSLFKVAASLLKIFIYSHNLRAVVLNNSHQYNFIIAYIGVAIFFKWMKVVEFMKK